MCKRAIFLQKGLKRSPKASRVGTEAANYTTGGDKVLQTLVYDDLQEQCGVRRDWFVGLVYCVHCCVVQATVKRLDIYLLYKNKIK